MTWKEKEVELAARRKQIQAWLCRHREDWRCIPLDRLFTIRNISKRDPLLYEPEARLFRDFPIEAQHLMKITEQLRQRGLVRIKSPRQAADWVLQLMYEVWI